jgi:hypothetical protein
MTTKTLFSLATFFIGNAFAVTFTFPGPEISNYVFATGDITILQWSPDEEIAKVQLICGQQSVLSNTTSSKSILDFDPTKSNKSSHGNGVPGCIIRSRISYYTQTNR